MIAEGWNEYRGWAMRARELQRWARRWFLLVFACGVLAAILGTAADQAGGGTSARQVLVGLAGIFAAISPIIASDILRVGSEAKWIRARSAAEAVKSECIRLSARAGIYGSGDATERFRSRLNEISDAVLKAGVTPIADPVDPGRDPRCPPDHLDAAWYLEHRLDEQLAYYRQAQVRHESAARRLRISNLMLAIVAAALGAVAAVSGLTSLGPWVGVITTIGAMLIASGLLDRREFLAATYARTAIVLQRHRAGFLAAEADLPALVSAVEDLLSAEHATWTERMAKALSAPVKPKVEASAQSV